MHFRINRYRKWIFLYMLELIDIENRTFLYMLELIDIENRLSIYMLE
jgi:hypothetical protein